MLIVELRNPTDKSSGNCDTRAWNPNHANSARERIVQYGRTQSNHQFGMQSKRDISLVLVRQEGEVLWCAKGVWTLAKAESLDETLLALTPLADDPDDCLFEDSQVGGLFERVDTRHSMPVFA